MPPLYDYACGSCGHKFEELTKGEQIPCPKCGQQADKQITVNYKIRMPDAANRPVGKRFT
jgi:putative FmdB family regulatory protein